MFSIWGPADSSEPVTHINLEPLRRWGHSLHRCFHVFFSQLAVAKGFGCFVIQPGHEGVLSKHVFDLSDIALNGSL